LQWPFIAGGANAATKFISMDRDSSGNFIIGGSGSSTDMMSGSTFPSPFVMFVTSTGTVSWTHQFDSAWNSVNVVKFDSATPTNIFAGLNFGTGG
jgi:hypothetical protein